MDRSSVPFDRCDRARGEDANGRRGVQVTPQRERRVLDRCVTDQVRPGYKDVRRRAEIHKILQWAGRGWNRRHPKLRRG